MLTHVPLGTNKKAPHQLVKGFLLGDVLGRLQGLEQQQDETYYYQNTANGVEQA
jgi:hypothetical protein